MPDAIQKADPRIGKTQGALMQALAASLQRRNFRRITVNDLCRRAQLSRTTFYDHFRDKYDLLDRYLAELYVRLTVKGFHLTQLEKTVNGFIQEHPTQVVNLLEDADTETQDLLLTFLARMAKLPIQAERGDEADAAYTALSNFCAGGLLNLLMWQVKNRFPKERKLLNAHIYQLVAALRERGPGPQ